jgi:hypothetical protein
LGLALHGDSVILVTTLIDLPPVQNEEGLAYDRDMEKAPTSSGASNQKAEQIARIVILSFLFVAPAFMAIRAACVTDFDIWWHMRVGEWIVQHHAVPHVDLFSSALAGKSWLPYSWLFELLMVKLFYWFGLVGIVAYTGGMILAITVAVYHLLRRLQGDFTIGLLLTFLGLFCCQHLFTPRPWLFSILFFVLELDILLHVRRTGRLRELAWLPLIFGLWANLHVEFIYGLAILGLALVEAVAGLRWKSLTPRVPPVWMGCALLASLLATLANPFGWHLYQVVYDLATQGGAVKQVSEMQSIPFRDLVDFFLLLLALGSAGMLARQRRIPIFEMGLLAFACFLSFRSQRDEWALAVVAVAILAASFERQKPAIRLPKFASGIAVLAACLALFVSFRLLHVNDTQLKAQVASKFPVHAVESIQTNGYSGPIYNDFNWGGYLIWTMRVPVVIDGRTNLYGGDRTDQSIATWNAQPDWSSDQQLMSAGIVIGPVKSPLTQVLRLDKRFRLAYEDKLAAVFVAQRATH